MRLLYAVMLVLSLAACENEGFDREQFEDEVSDEVERRLADR